MTTASRALVLSHGMVATAFALAVCGCASPAATAPTLASAPPALDGGPPGQAVTMPAVPADDAATRAVVDAPVAPTVDASPEASPATAPRADAAVQIASGAAIKTSSPRPAPSGAAHEGEMCATVEMPRPLAPPPFHRSCATGLVCCVPPHGAMMETETAYCRVGSACPSSAGVP
jgi:hypothetical protein